MSDNITKKTLNIAQFNAHSVVNKKQELQVFLREHNIDILLLSETFLKPLHKCYFQNYKLIRDDRVTAGGGTAIAIKRQIPHSELNVNKNINNLELTGVQIHVNSGRNINIYSVYKPPGKPLELSEIDELTKDNTPTLIAGDLNCKHEDWNSTVANYNGRKLAQHVRNTPTLKVYAPTEPTHHTQNSADVLDIILASNWPNRIHCSTVAVMNSDHVHVIYTINRGTISEKIRKYPQETDFDWKKFAKLVKE